MTLHVEPLAERHQVEAFRCGVPDLDEWLARHAHGAAGHGTRTHVLTDRVGTRVLGYFAIAPHLVARDELPRSIGRGGPARIPAILLAKLALAAELQGEGLGNELLVHALRTIVRAARIAGGRLLVVDALDDGAAAFYRARGFVDVPAGDRRLVLKLSTAARLLGEPWPS
ncbi:MAG: N-acetyltransferase [Solirubrobacteraceae bacterium]